MADFDYTPNAEDVAAIMRARTRTPDGTLGSFTPDTDPSLELVESLILPATGMVAAAIGQDIPADYLPAAKLAATACTAMLIELTIQQKAGTDETSAYQHYRDLYQDAIARIAGAVQGEPGPKLLRSTPLTSVIADAQGDAIDDDIYWQ